jgi:hypothetical protein
MGLWRHVCTPCPHVSPVLDRFCSLMLRYNLSSRRKRLLPVIPESLVALHANCPAVTASVQTARKAMTALNAEKATITTFHCQTHTMLLENKYIGRAANQAVTEGSAHRASHRSTAHRSTQPDAAYLQVERCPQTATTCGVHGRRQEDSVEC